MASKQKLLCLCACFGAGLLVAGCPQVGAFLNVVQVEVINDTDWPVAPDISYDDDDNWLAGIFPDQTLTVGLLESGESAIFTFDCDELGLIMSNDSAQVIPFFDDYLADTTNVIERDDEYECGDVIRFRFVGDGVDFGVIVSVNGRIVG